MALSFYIADRATYISKGAIITSIDITINNWDKYQPRKDLTKLSWFRLETDLFDGESYFKLKNNGLVLFIFLLSKAAKSNNPAISINLDFVCEKLKLKKDDILGTIDILKENQLVHESVRICTDLLPTIHNKQTNNTNNTNNTEHIFLDFESAYFLYPLKKGKSKGIKKISKEIKTQEDLDLFVVAIENYKKDLAKNKTDLKYVKHFSTFCAEWQDWANYDESLNDNTSSINLNDPISHAKAQIKRLVGGGAI